MPLNPLAMDLWLKPGILSVIVWTDRPALVG